MRGVLKLLWLPFLAISLLLLGCGVPIAPDAITATSVANSGISSSQSLNSTFSGSASDDSAMSLRDGSASLLGAPVTTAEPIATLASPKDMPDHSRIQTVDATSTPSPTSTPGASATPDEADETPSATPDGSTTPAATASASATPTEEPSPTPTPTPEPTATPAPIVEDVNSDFPAQFLQLLNAQRTGRGLPALTSNPLLAAGATKYAEYMGIENFFGHDAPDGSTPESRAMATGYPGSWNGEALSAGQIRPQDALNALLASPEHVKILLDPNAREVGIGYALVRNSHYISYWVVMTGIP